MGTLSNEIQYITYLPFPHYFTREQGRKEITTLSHSRMDMCINAVMKVFTPSLSTVLLFIIKN